MKNEFIHVSSVLILRFSIHQTNSIVIQTDFSDHLLRSPVSLENATAVCYSSVSNTSARDSDLGHRKSLTSDWHRYYSSINLRTSIQNEAKEEKMKQKMKNNQHKSHQICYSYLWIHCPHQISNEISKQVQINMHSTGIAF